MGIEGEESPGVVDGATFLREVNLGLKPSVGSRVGVVGGGNVAIDAARTALRLGAKEVKLLYRRSRAEMPADPSEVEQAIEEGVELHFLVAPLKITRANRQLRVTCVRLALGEPDASGRPRPLPIPDSEFEMEFDTLVAAIGQAPQVPSDFRLRIGKGSTVQVDPVTLLTDRTGVFAGGDAVTGPATVTEALAAGRRAALRIDEFLQHKYPSATKDGRQILTGELLPRSVESIRKINRVEPPLAPPDARSSDFRPVELIYDWKTAIDEARRCLRCGAGAEILFQDKCATCLNCLRVCPYHVPYLDSSGTIQIPADQCLACGVCVGECPARAIILRKPYDRRQVSEELEHTLRAAAQAKARPLVIGFCCQYGLFGTGILAGLSQEAAAGIWIVPVLCIAKVEDEHLLRAFELGADGVFVAGCGEQCAREDTALWLTQRVAKVRRALVQLGLKPEALQALPLQPGATDAIMGMDALAKQAGALYLTLALKQEVQS